jgi:hypothetical protein
MKAHDDRRRKSWMMLIAIFLLGTALLFGFEYLGSEQPQKQVDKPIPLPEKMANQGTSVEK